MVICFSHGIRGTLWHVNGGEDGGRGKVGRTGSPSLLTASSGQCGAALGAAGVMQGHRVR